MERKDLQPGGAERLCVLPSVFLTIDDHEVGGQRGDGVHVRILRSTHLRELRMLTPPRHPHGDDTEREQRLGGRGDEADYPWRH
ncbi:MAG: hypothetical protein NVSMB4_05660 [Acidimicrobiales bacterium]